MRVLRSLAAHPRLLLELVRRDVRGRFAGSRFGLLWSLLNPLVQLISYSVIFGYIYVARDPAGSSRFTASLFCGLWPWWALQEGTMRGLGAIVDQGSLLKKVPMPPELCVLAAVIASFLLQMLGFLIFVGVFSLLGITPLTARWLCLPAVMLLGLALTVGLGLTLAPLYLVVRDTVHVVNAILTIWFFSSPVLYAIEVLPERVRAIASFNPMVGLLGLYRYTVLGTEAPSAMQLVVCSIAVVVTWMAGSFLLVRLDAVLDEYW